MDDLHEISAKTQTISEDWKHISSYVPPPESPERSDEEHDSFGALVKFAPSSSSSEASSGSERRSKRKRKEKDSKKKKKASKKSKHKHKKDRHRKHKRLLER